MTPRRTFLITALVALGVVLAGCGSSSSTPEEEQADTTTSTTAFVPGTLPEDVIEEYVSDPLGFAIAFPSDWDVVEETDEGIVSFYARLVPEDTLVENYNVAVADVPAELDLAAFTQLDAGSLAAQVQDYRVVGGGDTVLDGSDAVSVVFEGTAEGVPIKVLRIVTIRDGRAYVFMFTANADEFENFLPVVDQILGAFRFVS